MDERIRSGDLELSAHVAVPPTPGTGLGLVLCHGLPNPPRGAAAVGTTYHDLADRIAAESGWVVLAFNFRGTGTSEGDFSARGWLDDIRATVRVLASAPTSAACGPRASVTAAPSPWSRPRTTTWCAASASFAAATNLHTWAHDPANLLVHVRSMGMIRTDDHPADPAVWVRDIERLDATLAAQQLGPRPLLVVHGNEDIEVPIDEARTLADAARASELRIVNGAGHRLRHDPRAIATLLGWLARQGTEAPIPDAL